MRNRQFEWETLVCLYTNVECCLYYLVLLVLEGKQTMSWSKSFFVTVDVVAVLGWHQEWSISFVDIAVFPNYALFSTDTCVATVTNKSLEFFV